MSEAGELTRAEAAGTSGKGDEVKPFGPVAAVFIAAGVGSLVLGILTTLTEASEGIKAAFEWVKPVGSLSGKAIVSSAVFFITWGILATVWKGKSPREKTIWWATGILVAIGIVMTFPIFFQLFTPPE